MLIAKNAIHINELELGLLNTKHSDLEGSSTVSNHQKHKNIANFPVKFKLIVNFLFRKQHHTTKKVNKSTCFRIIVYFEIDLYDILKSSSAQLSAPVCLTPTLYPSQSQVLAQVGISGANGKNQVLLFDKNKEIYPMRKIAFEMKKQKQV